MGEIYALPMAEIQTWYAWFDLEKKPTDTQSVDTWVEQAKMITAQVNSRKDN